MKLLECAPALGGCGDVVRIYGAWRACHCGRSRARYANDSHVIMTGPCRALGIDTGELRRYDHGTWRVSDRARRVSSGQR